MSRKLFRTEEPTPALVRNLMDRARDDRTTGRLYRVIGRLNRALQISRDLGRDDQTAEALLLLAGVQLLSRDATNAAATAALAADAYRTLGDAVRREQADRLHIAAIAMIR